MASQARQFQALQFRGWISCRRDGEGPLGLILVGRTRDRPEEPVQVAFASAAPVDLPDALEDARLERLGPSHYRLVSGDRSWQLPSEAHIHRDVAGAFYRALPPRPVPFHKRLFWKVLLALAGNPMGRWLLLRGG